MNTVFIGGSRHVSRLSAQVKERLDKIIENGHRVVVGDANGADKAVQKHLLEAAYKEVTVFCSGDHPRNNLGQWRTQNVSPPKGVQGFQFYAAKDREMAREADFGLMIWDGKSAGTILNVLRLVRAGKIAVLINVPEKSAINIKTERHWDEFLSQCSPTLRADLKERATADEWEAGTANLQPSLFDAKTSSKLEPTIDAMHAPSEEELAAVINAALASGDPASFVDALGNIARARGMTQVAKEAGLARESLYRSLGTGGNPEFATVLKVMAAVGLRLEASKAHAS
jgi:probable addiction module antidote protein